MNLRCVLSHQFEDEAPLVLDLDYLEDVSELLSRDPKGALYFRKGGLFFMFLLLGLFLRGGASGWRGLLLEHFQVEGVRVVEAACFEASLVGEVDFDPLFYLLWVR